MTHIKKLAILLIALVFTSTAMAATGTTTTDTTTSSSLEVKWAPVLVAKTNNSVTLSWNKVDIATSYIVKYSTKSVATSTEANPQYDNETDPVTSTGTVISGLTPNTDYYFSVVAVDKDNNESDTFSDELQVKTDNASVTAPATGSGVSATTAAPTAWAFALSNVTAIDNKTVSLEFSSALGTTPVTIKITKTSDNSDVPVASVTPDTTTPTKATAKISTILDPSSTYSVTVITASDVAGNTIKQGVDGIKEFPTLANLPASPETTLNAWSDSGATMSGTTTTPNLEAAKTGPKESLIITLALLLSLAVVYTYRKKFAK